MIAQIAIWILVVLLCANTAMSLENARYTYKHKRLHMSVGWVGHTFAVLGFFSATCFALYGAVNLTFQ